MKNIVKYFGIITFAAVIAFSMFACKSGEDEPGLTITGLEKFNGKYVFAADSALLGDSVSSGLVAAASVDMTNFIVTGGKVSDGSVTLKVWKAEGDADNVGLADYTGNDTVSFYVFILKDQSINMDTFAGIDENTSKAQITIELYKKVAGFGTTDVTFKNGLASGKLFEKSIFEILLLL
jgi:hypothetical protein